MERKKIYGVAYTQLFRNSKILFLGGRGISHSKLNTCWIRMKVKIHLKEILNLLGNSD